MPSDNRRFNRLHLILLMLALLLVGLAIYRWHPVWLAPPNFQHTPLMYATISLLWIPVGIIGFILRPAPAPPKRRWVVTIAGIVLILLGLFAIVNGALAAIVWEVVAFSNCSQETLPDGNIRYICTQSAIGGAYRFTLEGTPGAPFVELVNREILVD